MAFNVFRILKGLLISEENTLSPKQIEITPGGTSGTKTSIVSNQTSNKTLTLPDANDTLVGKATSDVLTNKSIDAATNTLSNISNAEIKAAAAIDASKIADGSVSNTEFQYLSNVTGDIQTQLNNKIDSTGALDPSKALMTDIFGHVSVSPTTSVQLSYLSGTTSNVQSQINAKASQSSLDTHTSASSAHGVVGSLVGTSDSQSLTNKTIDASLNSISNIANSNIATSAAIALSKLAALVTGKALQSNATTGEIEASSVTNTELGRLSGITSSAVGVSDAQVLTNKDIDGGTASNSSRITLPQAAKTSLDGLTRKAGTLVYDTTSNRPYYDDGSQLKLIGSGASAANFITTGDAESGTTGFATYDDASGSRPTDGV